MLNLSVSQIFANSLGKVTIRVKHRNNVARIKPEKVRFVLRQVGLEKERAERLSYNEKYKQGRGNARKDG